MIPKKIHYCWFGENEKPLLVIECIKSWQKYCPDYEIMEWNSKNYDVHKNKYMEQAYQAKRWGFVSDYARLDIIYQYGGIYLDTDVELIRSLDDLLETDGYIGFEKKVDEECDEVYVNTGQGFGASAFHPVVKAMMDIYKEIDFVEQEKENGEALPLRFYVVQVLFAVRVHVELFGLLLRGDQQRAGLTIVLPVHFLQRVSHGVEEEQIHCLVVRHRTTLEKLYNVLLYSTI